MGDATGGQMFPSTISVEDLEKQLARKRKALDHEIEKFMKLKDAEYRRFERELRNQCNGHAQERDEAATAGAARGRNATQSRQGASAQQASDLKKDIQSPLSTATLPTVSRNTAETQRKSTPTPANDTTQLSSRKYEELELRALFTPSFLPLLEGPANQSARGHRRMLSTDTGLRARRMSLDTETESHKLSASLTNISSGAKLESASFDGQTRPAFGDRRSSSSPTGTNLRKSSMRQPASPDQTPKERKHVLFSIDNVVISPSSSPVSTRTKGVGDVQASRKAPIPFSGLKDWPSQAQNNGHEPQPMNHSAAGSNGVPVPVPMKAAPASPTTPFSRSYKDLVEPTVMPPLKASDKEDLGIVEDPLFSADESLPPEVDEDWDMSSKEEDRSDEDKKFNIAASPGASSVPIEIKWPGRRTS